MAMTDTQGDTNIILTPAEAAEQYAALGWELVPITPGYKHPRGIGEWQNHATDNLDTIRNWYTGLYRGYGVGVMTGRRSGFWVLDVDIDKGKPGDENLAILIDRHGPLPVTVEAETGSGGGHILFEYDPDRPITNGSSAGIRRVEGLTYILNSKGQPEYGLDIRGDGGYIVATPTIHPDYKVPYRWLPGRGPWDVQLAPAPDWLYDLLLAEPVVTTTTPPPRPAGQPTGDSIADIIRATNDWHATLEGDGWTLKYSTGGDGYWVRPGKNPRDGHSAVLHNSGDGPLVVFTTEISPAVASLGRPTIDGSGISLTLFDYLAGTRHNGNRSSLAREARLELNATQRTAPAVATHCALRYDSGPRVPISPLNLPDEFWQARPELDHIRQAAWSRLLSPDAVFGVILARAAARTHPAICLPSIVGAQASLSCYTALTGPPGTGKSTSIGAAADLMPIACEQIAQGGQLGSGEGLIELYIEEEDYTDDEGKKKTRRVHRKHGAFVTLDEGAALAELGARKGSTVLSILRSMWTGGAIGQANASAATTRTLRAGGYNLGFVIGIQPSLAGALLSDDAAGTPQRFLWMRTTDPTIPADPIAWPGRLNWVPPTRRGEFGADITIDPQIARDVRAAALARNRGEHIIDSLDAHADLLRLKIAGLLAVLNGRQAITLDDWELAEMVGATSVAVRADVMATVQWEAEEKARASDRAAARRAKAVAVATDEHQQTEIERTLESAARSVVKRISKEGSATRAEVTRSVSGRARKAVTVDEVIDHAIGLGWLANGSDGGFVLGPKVGQ